MSCSRLFDDYIVDNSVRRLIKGDFEYYNNIDNMNFAYHFRMITNNSGQFVKYLSLQTQVQALRGQMLWRAKNLGVKQLDLIVGSWAKIYLKQMNMTELKKFNKQIIQQQTPDILRKILGYQQIEADEKYIRKIKDFAVDDKFSKLE